MKQTKILIVEDDALFADFLASTLSPHFEVKIATDCLAAVEELDDFQPDALVLDLLMPAATGFDLLNEMASYPDTAKIPVVLCSSVTQALNQDVLKANGVVAVIDKTSMQPRDVYYQLKAILVP